MRDVDLIEKLSVDENRGVWRDKVAPTRPEKISCATTLCPACLVNIPMISISPCNLICTSSSILRNGRICSWHSQLLITPQVYFPNDSYVFPPYSNLRFFLVRSLLLCANFGSHDRNCLALDNTTRISLTRQLRDSGSFLIFHTNFRTHFKRCPSCRNPKNLQLSTIKTSWLNYMPIY